MKRNLTKMKKRLLAPVCAAALYTLSFAGAAEAAEGMFNAPYCVSGPLLNAPKEKNTGLAAGYPADVASDWYEMQNELIFIGEGFTPPVVSRALAYSGAVLYETVMPGMPGKRSLSEVMPGLSHVPVAGKDAQIVWAAAANKAMYDIVKHLYLDRRAFDAEYLWKDEWKKIYKKVDDLYEKHASRYRDKIEDRLFFRSEKRGQDVAAAIYAWSLSDGGHEGYRNNFPVAFKGTDDPAAWTPTTIRISAGLQPGWGDNRPFALEDKEHCMPPEPHAYSEEPGSAFYSEAKEVYDVSRNLSEEQRDIAEFWADDPGKSATPPGHTMALLTKIMKKKGKRLDFAAEAYFRMGVALADAFIGCWHAKYHYDLVRPITYIRRTMDEHWIPAVATPPFPEYPSGHSVQIGAASSVFAALFGEDLTFVDDTKEKYGMHKPRSYGSFSELANEAAMSRLYGGIHFRAAIENGVEQGKCIGKRAANLSLDKTARTAAAH